MYPERKKGLSWSAGFHLLMLLLAIFGLPSLLTPEPPPEPITVTLLTLPVTGVTNVKPEEETPPTPKPDIKPEPPAPQPPKPTPKAEPPKPTPPPPPKPVETPPEPKPDPKPEVKPEPLKPPEPKPPEPKPEPPKPTPPKPKPPKPKATEEDLDQVLKNLAAEAQNTKTDEKAKATKPKANAAKPSHTTKTTSQYNDALPMSLSEKDAVMSQIAKCWSPPSGVMNAHALVVVVKADFNNDGSVIDNSVVLTRESASKANGGDMTYRAAAEAALRAVKECSPLKDLPPEKYETWRSMELRFDPKNML